MYSLVYVSSAVKLLKPEELENLLAKSRQNNAPRGITGMLLYKEGNFMQFLEGPRDAVLELMEIVKADPRHRGLMVLLQEDQPERQFADWSMGFKRLKNSDHASAPGHSNFLNLPLISEEFQLNPSRSLQLLLSFRKTVGTI